MGRKAGGLIVETQIRRGAAEGVGFYNLWDMQGEESVGSRSINGSALLCISAKTSFRRIVESLSHHWQLGSLFVVRSLAFWELHSYITCYPV